MKFFKRRETKPRVTSELLGKPAVPLLNYREEFEPDALAARLPELACYTSAAAASHWIDDGGTRNTLQDRFVLLLRFLTPGGKIFFESHCNDLNDDNYEVAVDQICNEFNLRIAFRRMLDNDTRDYIVFEHQA